MTDLHMHTIYSDGSDDIPTLLKNAQAKRLSLISITDHNSVGAYEALKDTSTRSIFSGKIITGTELTTNYNGETIEILGYGVNVTVIDKYIKKNYLPRSEIQKKTFDVTYRKYSDIGCILDININDFNPETMYARPFIYKALQRCEENKKFFAYAESMINYDKFIRLESGNPESPLFIDLSPLHPTPDNVINAIHDAGGLAFIAHLFLYTEHIYKDIQYIIEEYKPDGLECYYSKFGKEQTEYIVSLCKRNNLFLSGGSDYHGTNRPGIELGTGHGDLCVDETDVYRWADTFMGY